MIYKEKISSQLAVMLLLAATVACLVPFINKPFHIDDPYFVWIAKHITSNPLDFFGFYVNWSGEELPVYLSTTNPPIVSYYMALAASILGWSEISLHVAFLVPACAVVAGTWLLARDLCSRPFLAAFAVICTPVFLVSATTLMCDVLMLSFWIFAIVFWRRGLKSDDLRQLAFAAILIILAILTKYSAVCIVPLLLAYSLVEKRKIGIWIIFLLLPLFAVGLYDWATYCLYGTRHLSFITSFTASARKALADKYVSGMVTGISFVGGCLLFPMCYALLLGRRFKLILGFAVVVSLLILLMSLGVFVDYPIADADGINWRFVAQFPFFVFSGICFFFFVLKDIIHNRDPDSLLLFLWVIGIFAFSTVVNWSVNGRSILPIVPVSGIVVIRYIERIDPQSFITDFKRLYMPLFAALIIGLSLSFADYRLAIASHDAAIRVSSIFDKSPGNLWYEGHWGFQYYMTESGRGKPVDYEKPLLAKGDLVIIPSFNTNLKLLYKTTAYFMQEFRFDDAGFLSTMNPKYGAGFYSDLAGPLPFAIGSQMPEKYFVYKMVINKKSRFSY
jgi:hypothetical protein